MGNLSKARVSTARKMHVDTTTTVASASRIHRGLVKIFQGLDDFIQEGFDPAMDASMLKQKIDKISRKSMAQRGRRISISSLSTPVP
jgi:hypothetical protein